jgi:hypothetical protein
LNGDAQRCYPTFSLALRALEQAHWSALSPQSALRRWQLIELGSGTTLTQTPLRIAERVLHFLTGVTASDERLAGLIVPVHGQEKLPPSHTALVARIVAAWQRPQGRLPAIVLIGEERSARQAIAAAACHQLGLNLHRLCLAGIPATAHEREPFARLWVREAALGNSALLIDAEELDANDARRQALNEMVDWVRGAVIVSQRERQCTPERPVLALRVERLPSGEQAALWRSHLQQHGIVLNGQLDRLLGQFSLSAQQIRSAGDEVARQIRHTALPDEQQIVDRLWAICRTQTQPTLAELAQLIQSKARWGDLVLPEAQQQLLRDMASHARQRSTVYQKWGFAEKGGRGLGMSALFAGVSGTGKTLAAEVLANELQLDLYRIDLSAVVSKYIGETEKNLRRIFDAAEDGGALLLFDEADALFGKRSEVKDSHDRYANIEVSYLLQRIEAYRGLAILTTNLKHALDQAFLRRIRFVVQFPFPDMAQRMAIWQRIFPAATPTQGLDYAQLARLNVAGGNIRNIALNAAFLAADAEEVVQMRHVLRAARVEYAKLERTLSDAEVDEWVV